MKRVLLTGMSATGKSSVVRALVERGYWAIDTDDGWCEPLPDGRQQWREDAITALLNAEHGAEVLFVAGCEDNQVKFHSLFDKIILLSAPRHTLLERLATRTTNSYGSTPVDVRRILEDIEVYEPRLRTVAHLEVNTTVPLDEVVDTILRAVDA